jgi:hypothetical protein
MSVRLPAPAHISDQINDDDDSGPSESESEDDDQTWDDWVSDSNVQQQCKSLFCDQVLPSLEAALAYDKETYHFSLDEACKRLCELRVALLSIFAERFRRYSTGFSWSCSIDQLYPKTCTFFHQNLSFSI